MKSKEAELMIVRARLQTTRRRAEELEAEEERLLFLLGYDPSAKTVLTISTAADAEAVLAYFRSPSFARDMKKQTAAFSKALKRTSHSGI